MTHNEAWFWVMLPWACMGLYITIDEVLYWASGVVVRLRRDS